MKTLIAIVTLLSAAILTGCSKPHEHPPATQTYWCPMHPEVTSTDPNAQCDKCGGMKLLPKEGAPAPKPTKPAAKAGQFTCPMHPNIVADKPGDCPICSMRLVPITDTPDEHAGHAMPAGLTAVRVSGEVRQAIGLKVGRVEARELTREIRTSARIVPDESRLSRVSVKFEGWVDKLFVAVTGQAVKQGDPLLTVYSPDLVSAQQEYLLATDSVKQAARRRLELWDISAAQIEQLEKTGQVEKTLTIFAPAAGVVVQRMVLPGQKIMPSEPLLEVADLSVVWADADIYQPDLPLVKKGRPVTVEVGTQSFEGQVTFVTPTLDPATRTAKARLEIANPDQQLKPGMFATARIHASLGRSLAIPEAAVLRSGERAYAFRDEGDGRLMPVEIKIGARAGEFFQLLEGLQEGDAVVTSANFLVDSESQLRAARAGMSGHSH